MSYDVDFLNKTDCDWTIAHYLTFSSSMALDSVACSPMTVKAGHLGCYGAQLVPPTLHLGVYSQDVYRVVGGGVNVLPGSVWEIHPKGRTFEFRELGQHGGKEVSIRNRSGSALTVGMTMTRGASVFMKALESEATLKVNLLPAIYVGLFNDVKSGEVISGNVTVGPLLLQSPTPHENVATVTATSQGGQTVLSVTYSRIPLGEPRPGSGPLPTE